MKKLIAILLCSLMLVAVAACAKTTDKPADVANDVSAEAGGNTDDEPIELPELPFPDEPSEIMAGGWMIAEDNTITEERKAIFDKALAELLGVDYVPVAYLGSQVVAGTNHCFLTQATIVYPDAVPKCALVYLYEDLEGNVTLMNVADLPVVPNDDGTAVEPIGDETLDGGWAFAEDPTITDEIRAKLEKALAELVGASYEPIANIATQVVAGMNRCLLCKVTPVVPDAIPHYALVYVYEDLEGGATLQFVIDFDFGALCTYGA